MGNKDALKELAQLYDYGRGVEKNYDKAHELYEKHNEWLEKRKKVNKWWSKTNEEVQAEIDEEERNKD